MNDELDVFLDQFYGKYAPNDIPQGDRRARLKEKLSQDFEGYATQMYQKYAPDLVPDQERLSRLRAKYLPNVPAQEQEAPNGVMSAISQFNRGFYQNLISEPLKFIGSLGKFGNTVPERLSWDPATQLGQAAEQFIERYNPVDPEGGLASDVARGLGQGASMLLTGPRGAAPTLQQALRPGLVPAAQRAAGEITGAMKSPGGILGSIATAQPAWEEAKAAGLDDDQAFNVMMQNYLIGSTEAIPVANLLGRLNRATGNRFVNLLKAKFSGSFEEFIQEGLQTYLSNQVAKANYDPDRDPMFQVLEGAEVGGIVGFILPSVGAAVSGLPPSARAKVMPKITSMIADAEAKSVQTGDPTLDAAIDQAGELSEAEKQILNQRNLEESRELKEQEDAEEIRADKEKLSKEGEKREAGEKVSSDDVQRPTQAGAETREPGALISKTGATQGFFSDVVTGKSDIYKPVKPYEPLLPRSEEEAVFETTYAKHKGQFDEHIATSIPAFRDVQVKKGNAIVKSLPEGGTVIDIAGSEGGLMKAVTEQSGGAIKTINLDVNPDMKAAHESTPIPGAEFVQGSFLTPYENIPAYKPTEKADVVHESMAFQFMSPQRGPQFKEVAENYLKPGGLFIVEEKVGNPEWNENEVKKDQAFKSKYYTPEQIETKNKTVQVSDFDANEGMAGNMVTEDVVLRELQKHFKHIRQYWDGGNFKGYVASNNRSKVDNFVKNVGSTNSEFSNRPDDQLINITTGLKERQEKSVKMTPGEALKHQVQTFYRGMTKGVRKGKELTNELVTKVQEAAKEHALTPKQLGVLLTRIRSTNLFTPGSKSKLNVLIDKVTARADFAEQLDAANELRSQVKSVPKGISQRIRTIAKEFAKIDPSLNPSEYIDVASQLVASFKRPGTKGYAPVNATTVSNFIDRQLLRQHQEDTQALREEFDLGPEFSDDEVAMIMEPDEDLFSDNADETKKKIARDKILRVAQYTQLAVPEDGPKELETLRDAPLEKLSIEQLVDFIRVVDNIAMNDDYSGVELINTQIEVVQDAEKLSTELGGKKRKIGSIKAETYSVPLFFKAIFSSSKKAAKFQLRSGLGNIFQGDSRAEGAEHRLFQAFRDKIKSLERRKLNPTSAKTNLRTGIFSVLVRYPEGADPQSAFEQSKRNIELSIERLKQSDKYRKMAEDTEKVYADFSTARDIADVFARMKKIDPAGYEMWTFFRDKFKGDVRNRLKETTEKVHNEPWVDEENYTPKAFLFVDPVLQEQQARRSSLPSAPRQAGTAIAATNRLRPGQAINPEFYSSMFSKFRESMNDIETSKHRLKFREFMKLPQAAELVGGVDNKRKIIENYKKAEAIQLGLGKDYSDAGAILNELIGGLRTLSYTAALGSFDQFAKQSIPVAVNTIINLGTDANLFWGHVPKDLIAMYTIGQRGKRLGGVERGESTRYKIQSQYRNKALKAARGLHGWSDKWAGIFMKSLTSGDVSVAERSWAAYYKQYLKTAGIRNINMRQEASLQNDPIRQEAAAYAEQRTSETQVVSNPSQLANISRPGSQEKEWLRNIVIPFSQFAINLKGRIVEDVQQLRTSEDKAAAVRSLAGTMTEVVTYATISRFLLPMLYNQMRGVIRGLFNLGDEEEEDIDFRIKQLYSSVIKEFSPWAVGKVGETATSEVINRIAYLFTNPDASYKEWQKDAPIYQYKGDSGLTDLGLYSAGAERVQDFVESVKDLKDVKDTGYVTDTTPWGDKEVPLDQDQENFLAFMAVMNWFATFVGMDATLYRQVHRIYEDEKRGKSGGDSLLPAGIRPAPRPTPRSTPRPVPRPQPR